MREREEILQMINDVELLYGLGGPQLVCEGMEPSASASWDPTDFHGYVMASLNDPELMDSDGLSRFLREHAITDTPALRALLRVVGSSAAIAVLRWVVDEWPAVSAVGGPLSRTQVLAEVGSSQDWAWWYEADDHGF